MQNFISPRGRLGRPLYAVVTLAILLLLAATIFVPALGWVRATYEGGRTKFSAGPGLWPALLLLWPLACLQLNRLRDMGTSRWWALAPIVVLTAAASVIQLTDGIRMVLNVGLTGDAAVRYSMPTIFWPSYLAMAWAGLACLGGVGWLSFAPSRRP